MRYNIITMPAKYINGNVIAQCPTETCNGSMTTYEHTVDNKNLGELTLNKDHYHEKGYFSRIGWFLFRCAACHSGAMAKIHANDDFRRGEMESFWPLAGITNPLPKETPGEIKKEYREAEKCYSVGAYRAASAMVRSVLEKTLKLNGYKNDDSGLQKKIELAATEGVITSARAERAKEKIKILGDDVLHDQYRDVTSEEAGESLHYAQRILEDLYDERTHVEMVLHDKKRLIKKEAIS
jgi:hypothetical protein